MPDWVVMHSTPPWRHIPSVVAGNRMMRQPFNVESQQLCSMLEGLGPCSTSRHTCATTSLCDSRTVFRYAACCVRSHVRPSTLRGKRWLPQTWHLPSAKPRERCRTVVIRHAHNQGYVGSWVSLNLSRVVFRVKSSARESHTMRKFSAGSLSVWTQLLAPPSVPSSPQITRSVSMAV
jgi:hypothetical protein